MKELPEKLATGIVKKSHGVKGFLRVRSFSGETKHFKELNFVFIRMQGHEKQYVVEEVKPFNSSDVLIKLEGVNNPEDGKAFIGKELWVKREHAAPLKKYEYYVADLCRCSVYKSDKYMGKVVSIAEGNKSQLLEVKDKKGKLKLIPFEERFVKSVDINSGKIDISEDYPE